jgi:hypothetical protein
MKSQRWRASRRWPPSVRGGERYSTDTNSNERKAHETVSSCELCPAAVSSLARRRPCLDWQVSRHPVPRSRYSVRRSLSASRSGTDRQRGRLIKAIVEPCTFGGFDGNPSIPSFAVLAAGRLTVVGDLRVSKAKAERAVTNSNPAQSSPRALDIAGRSPLSGRPAFLSEARP